MPALVKRTSTISRNAKGGAGANGAGEALNMSILLGNHGGIARDMVEGEAGVADVAAYILVDSSMRAKIADFNGEFAVKWQ
jgi:hypothetical protein